jgi:hypothetical protein
MRIQMTKAIRITLIAGHGPAPQLLLADGVLNGKEWGAKTTEFLIACRVDLHSLRVRAAGPTTKKPRVLRQNCFDLRA